MLLAAVTDRVGSDAKRSRQNADWMFQDLAISAQEVVTEAATRSEALMRENCRAGARKTLAGGFAIVRDVETRLKRSSFLLVTRQ